MAELVSPGVSISVTDESFYAAAGAGTVPLLVIATAQDKPAPEGSGIASATTAAEAGKVNLITSQRELLSLYGNPVFKSTGSTQLHGHELNEYGLLAAYSFLGASNRAYVVRADVDLDALAPRVSEPVAPPAAGSYWLDTSTVWGLKRWDGTKWVRQTVTVPVASQMINGSPKPAFGQDGEFAAVYYNSAGLTLDSVKLFHKISGNWYTIGETAWQGATSSEYLIAQHTNLPAARAGGGQLVVGDMLVQMTEQNAGTDWDLSVYSNGQFVSAPVLTREFSHEAAAEYAKTGLSVGDIWAKLDSSLAKLELKRWTGAQTTRAQGIEILANQIPAGVHGTSTVAVVIDVNNGFAQNGAAGQINVTLDGYDSDGDGFLTVDDVVSAINNAISGSTASLAFTTGLTCVNLDNKIVLESALAYDIKISGGTVANFDATDLGLEDSVPYTNWAVLSYEASATAIEGSLADGTLWYDSLISNTNIDIMYNNAGTWAGYPGDVQVTATQPTTQSDGASPLVAGDLWISAADLEEYPRIYKRTASNTWAEVDTTDQVSGDGILFADFRSVKGAAVDADAPQPTLYPYDILGWNFRLSGGNVKKWNASEGVWENYSANKADGSPNLLRRAQRAAVVRQLQSAIASNTDLRNESNRFNLISCPGYPELLDDMITLNVDRKETAFIVGDAPLRLAADATSTQAWANNENVASENGEDGLITTNAYAAIYYPHGLTTNLDGSNVVVPASHIALRTMAFNDQVAFPWFAPAGFQRGVVTNASSVGYVGTTGEFTPVALSEGQRDSLYINNLNPIGSFPGRGLAVFGQKTLYAQDSALDRVNVARLVVYIRERLDDIVKPFLFEPNDEVTRQNAKTVVDRFLANLVTQRGLFDFVTVCDTSNNTAARIDRNELHIDIAIQPLKAIEFIYIPIRVQNTLGQSN